MPNMPCFADLAARDYAHEMGRLDQLDQAACEIQDSFDDMTVTEVRKLLKQHEKDQLDELLFEFAYRMVGNREPF